MLLGRARSCVVPLDSRLHSRNDNDRRRRHEAESATFPRDDATDDRIIVCVVQPTILDLSRPAALSGHTNASTTMPTPPSLGGCVAATKTRSSIPIRSRHDTIWQQGNGVVIVAIQSVVELVSRIDDRMRIVNKNSQIKSRWWCCCGKIMSSVSYP